MNFILSLHSGKKILILLTLLISIIFSVAAFFPTQAQQPPKEPEFNLNQKDGLSKAQEQYKTTINCYFNTAAQNWIKSYNAKYQKDTQYNAPAIEIDTKELGCDKLGPVGNILYKQLQELFTAVDTNLTDTGKRTLASDANKDTQPLPVCNFIKEDPKNPSSLLKQPLELDPNPTNDYFKTLGKEVVSPVYAVAVVSQCYQAVYESYLNQYYASGYNASTTAQDLEKSSVRSDELLTEVSKRAVDRRAEIERIEKSLDLALADFQEMIQTYPLHVRYEMMIYHSQKLRDQFKVLRGVFDQLQYKLPNQSKGE